MTNVNDLAQRLRQQSRWFGELTETQQYRLVEAGKVVSLSPKQRLFERGASFDGIYVVLRGVLWVSGVDDAGNEIGLTILEPGQWFGELALFDGLSRTHDVTALQSAELFKIGRTELQSLTQQDSQWWYHFGCLMASKTRLIMQNLEDRHLSSAMQRLIRRLQVFYMQRAPTDANSDSITLPISQEQLAQLLGLSRQKTNRLLKVLAQQGVVSLTYGKVTIINASIMV